MVSNNIDITSTPVPESVCTPRFVHQWSGVSVSLASVSLFLPLRKRSQSPSSSQLWRDSTCCAVLCRAVLCCAVLCCAVLCCVVLCCAVHIFKLVCACCCAEEAPAEAACAMPLAMIVDDRLDVSRLLHA